MNRRASPLSLLLIVMVFILLAFYVARRMKIPRQTPPYPSANAPVPEEKRPPQEYRRSRRREGQSQREQPERQDQTGQPIGLTCTSQYFQTWQEPAEEACNTSFRSGYSVPDPRCTPGGINPSVTEAVLHDPNWRTRFVRNCESSESRKHVAYRWYGISAPHGNSGKNQVCELDHLVPLELGGADGLGNIWPECGPDATTLVNRYFKMKDRVENYLARVVKAGQMSLDIAQKGIASDWTQYLSAANQYCSNGGRC